MAKSGMREHPLLKAELANRAFVCRWLHRLGLNLEVVKPIGRPRGRRRQGHRSIAVRRHASPRRPFAAYQYALKLHNDPKHNNPKTYDYSREYLDAT